MQDMYQLNMKERQLHSILQNLGRLNPCAHWADNQGLCLGTQCMSFGLLSWYTHILGRYSNFSKTLIKANLNAFSL